jgi:N-acetylglucosamine-6-phosphate deacetylase
MELLLKLKGSNGIILITDSIRAGGMHEGEYEFADQKILHEGKPSVSCPTEHWQAAHLTLNKASQKYDQKSKCEND